MTRYQAAITINIWKHVNTDTQKSIVLYRNIGRNIDLDSMQLLAANNKTKAFINQREES